MLSYISASLVRIMTYDRSRLLIVEQSQSVFETSPVASAQKYGYTPFGWRPADPLPQGSSGFNGRMQEGGTFCYHLGHGYRAFNPSLFRFHRPDSHSPFGRGGLNCYAYCSGDPVNRRDDNGHVWSWLQKFLGQSPTVRYRRPIDLPSVVRAKNSQLIAPSITTFDFEHADKNFLVINTHADRSGRLTYNEGVGQFVGVDVVYETLLSQKVSFRKYDALVLLACHGASGGSNSSAARLAILSKKPVIGYREVVAAVGTARMSREIKASSAGRGYPMRGPLNIDFEVAIEPYKSRNVVMFELRRG